MSIGLFDLDMAEYVYVPFNLELMKIGDYYKKKGEVVVLSPIFSPFRHSLFYLRKDIDDGKYPELAKYKNIIYGGYAFSGENYRPMDMIFEKRVPDKQIYLTFQKSFREKSKKKAVEFRQMLGGDHCRLSLDDKSIWEDYECQFEVLKSSKKNKLIIFHDYNLNSINDGIKEMARISNLYNAQIGTKFPLQISGENNLLSLKGLLPKMNFFSLEYLGVIKNHAFLEFFKDSIFEKFQINLNYSITAGPPSGENHFSEADLLRIYYQIIFLRKYQFKFLLNYDENFFSDENWKKVFWLMSRYFGSLKFWDSDGYNRIIETDTMYDFCKNIRESQYLIDKEGKILSVTRNEAREIFAFVKENCYPLFKEFYECNSSNVEEKMYDLN